MLLLLFCVPSSSLFLMVFFLLLFRLVFHGANGPRLVVLGVHSQNNNWGLDPFDLISKVGLEDTVAKYFGVTKDTHLSDRNMSFLLAWVTTEVLEPVRIAFTVLGAKHVRKMIDARQKQAGNK